MFDLRFNLWVLELQKAKKKDTVINKILRHQIEALKLFNNFIYL